MYPLYSYQVIVRIRIFTRISLMEFTSGESNKAIATTRLIMSDLSKPARSKF